MKPRLFNIRLLFFTIIVLFFAETVNAQKVNPNEALADLCYRNGEYAKAVGLYEDLYNSNNNDARYYQRYVQCLEKTEDYTKAEKVIKKQIKRNPDNYAFTLDLAKFYTYTNQPEKAEKEYQNTINSLKPNVDEISELATIFVKNQSPKLALQTYKQGQKLLGNKRVFAFEIATMLSGEEDKSLYVNEMLEILEADDAAYQQVQASFQDHLKGEKEYGLLKSNLLKRIQNEPNNIPMTEMLVWGLTQIGNFSLALNQIIALDKRTDANGSRIIDFARICVANEAYDVAVNAYQNIINQGSNAPLYLNARLELLETQNKKITSSNYNETDLATLETNYRKYFEEFGRTNATAASLKDFANFLARYRNKAPEAIDIFNSMLAFTGMSNNFINQCKLDLADTYIFTGEVWEATLLYGQVDKAYRDEPLGQQAKFRNARLSYYNGDFDWSKAQLDVLKASTSNLIANDALNLSLVITENLGDDSIHKPLKMYAAADLLVFQSLFDKASNTLDSINTMFLDNTLGDEILWLRAQIAIRQNKTTDAINNYQEIIQKFPTDIFADDALFALAQVYQNTLADKTKAMEIYQQIIDKYPGSLFLPEARKQYRILRGDAVTN